MDGPRLVDRIYECAFMPDEWPSVLQRARSDSPRPAVRLSLRFLTGQIHRFAGSTAAGVEAIRPLVESGLAREN